MLFSVFREDHSLVFVVIWLSGCVHVGSDGNMTFGRLNNHPVSTPPMLHHV